MTSSIDEVPTWVPEHVAKFVQTLCATNSTGILLCEAETARVMVSSPRLNPVWRALKTIQISNEADRANVQLNYVTKCSKHYARISYYPSITAAEFRTKIKRAQDRAIDLACELEQLGGWAELDVEWLADLSSQGSGVAIPKDSFPVEISLPIVLRQFAAIKQNATEIMIAKPTLGRVAQRAAFVRAINKYYFDQLLGAPRFDLAAETANALFEELAESEPMSANLAAKLVRSQERSQKKAG